MRKYWLKKIGKCQENLRGIGEIFNQCQEKLKIIHKIKCFLKGFSKVFEENEVWEENRYLIEKNCWKLLETVSLMSSNWTSFPRRRPF